MNPIADLRLIVIDHAALLHGGEFNVKRDFALTMWIINRITKEACVTVLVLVHACKSASSHEKSDASMMADQTVFTDHARAALVLSTMRKTHAVKLTISDKH